MRLDQSVLLQLSQRRRQHVLGDTGNRASKFAKAVQPPTQQKENLQFPLAGQNAQGVSDFDPQRVTIVVCALAAQYAFSYWYDLSY